MSLDIAPPAPVSQTPASGGPPGAGPPTSASAALAFAALLAQQGGSPAGRAPHAGTNTDDNARDDSSRDTHADKHSSKDGGDDPANPGLSLVSLQPLPTDIPIPVSAVVLPGPPVPLALMPLETGAQATDTAEAMDTSLASVPAPQGGTGLHLGGELLPQTAQTTAPLSAPNAEHAAAPFSRLLDTPPMAPASAAGPALSAAAGPALSAPFAPAPKAGTLTAVPAGREAGTLTAAGRADGGSAAASLAASSPALPSLPTAVPDAALPAAGASFQALPITASARASSLPVPTSGVVSTSALASSALVSALSPAASKSAPAGALAADVSASAASMPVSAGAAALDAPAASSALPPSTPDTAASASTKLALQGYAQFGQTALQNTAQPANNTSIGKNNTSIGRHTPALPALGALETAGKTNAGQPLAVLPAPALPDSRTMQDWAQMSIAQAEQAKDKANKGSEDSSGAALLPMAAPAGEAKAAAAPAAPVAPADRAALMQQAGESVQALHAQGLGHGRGQMTLQLHPQDWGKLQVSVSMTPDAKGTGGTLVTAHVVADSAAVKQALETGGADLRRTLREAGLHLERLTVTVRPAEAGSEAQSLGSGSGGNGRQQPQDTQSWTTPGSQGSNMGSTAAGNGGNTFGAGGGGNGTRNPEHRQTALAAIALGAEHDEPDAPALTLSSAAGRLDTRA